VEASKFLGMVKGIHTVLCQVSDMNRSVKFYRDILGLTPGVESPYWTDFLLGGTRIGLHPPFGGTTPAVSGGWILGLQVDDLPALRRTLSESGFSTENQYHDTPSGCVWDFHDPDGNPIQAIQVGTKSSDFA
jgi:catechol 2,3-dioxygenase-like lactoylglutathione lyase family enzyme